MSARKFKVHHPIWGNFLMPFCWSKTTRTACYIVGRVCPSSSNHDNLCAAMWLQGWGGVHGGMMVLILNNPTPHGNIRLSPTSTPTHPLPLLTYPAHRRPSRG